MGRKHEPVNLDEAFVVDVACDTGEPIRATPIVTGLSDEEDAARYLALRFNPDLLFCTNCEVAHDGSKVGRFCPSCFSQLSPLGTPPAKRKRRLVR